MKGSNFTDDFCQIFGELINDKFSNVYVGSDKVEIENSTFSFLVITNLYEIITSGKVTTQKKNDLIIISCTASFSNYTIFWTTLSILYSERIRFGLSKA